NADPMLGYLTTSFRDHPRLRRRHGRQIASAMSRRLTALNVPGGERAGAPDVTAHLFAVYAKAGGDRRTPESLADEGRRKLNDLRLRLFDLGYGSDAGSAPLAEARLEAIYEHARRALYATIDDHILDEVAPRR